MIEFMNQDFTNHEWNEQKNARRIALIDKEVSGFLAPDEAIELAVLQKEVADYLKRVAPLPIAECEALLKQLQAKFGTNAVP